jgi:hypothetical protein
MGRGCGGEAPAGYFTLNYYNPPPKYSTKCPPMLSGEESEDQSHIIVVNNKKVYCIWT